MNRDVSLGGWTRLWVVLAVLIWAGGFIGLGDRPPIAPDKRTLCANYGVWHDAAKQHDDRVLCSTNRFAEADARRRLSEHWALWLYLARGDILFWASLPLLIGVLMVAIGWVRKGFTRVG